VELLAAVEAADRTGENLDADDLVHEFDDPTVDAERDTLALLDGTGRAATGGADPVTAGPYDFARDDDEITSFLLGYVYPADTAATGVSEVGTRPTHRHRGAASALLAAGLSRYREAGYQRAAFGVDAADPTGALRIYERRALGVSESWFYKWHDRAPTPAQQCRAAVNAAVALRLTGRHDITEATRWPGQVTDRPCKILKLV